MKSSRYAYQEDLIKEDDMRFCTGFELTGHTIERQRVFEMCRVKQQQEDEMEERLKIVVPWSWREPEADGKRRRNGINIPLP